MPRREKGKVPGGSDRSRTVIYVEVGVGMKSALGRIATRHNRRLTGEVVQALQEYLERHQDEIPPEGVAPEVAPGVPPAPPGVPPDVAGSQPVVGGVGAEVLGEVLPPGASG